MVDRVADWSLSADGNTSIAGVSIAEQCPVANLNNMGREIMAAIRAEISEQGATVTAATLTTISGASELKPLAGNTTIDGFDTAVTGMYRELRVLGTPVLKNNAATAIKGGANLNLAAGDLLRTRSLGAGNWIVQVDKADGSPPNNPTDIGATITASSLIDISSLPVLKPMLGSTTIDGFTTAVTGMYRETRVLSSPLMKHNATSNIIPGGANVTLGSGDLLRSRSLGAGKWLHYIDKGNGTALAVAASSQKIIGLYGGTYSANTDLTANIPTGSQPATTDGTLIITIASVVTTTSTQKVRIRFNGTSGHVAGAGLVIPSVAIFRGTTYVGRGTGVVVGGSAGANILGPLTFGGDDAPAAAGTYSYKAYVGLDAGTMRMNGSVSAAITNAVTSMLIEVYEP